jgi:acyl-CoA thioester hydrolase
MPVIDLSVQYRRPARYDDMLVVRCMFPDTRPLARVSIDYEVFLESEPEQIIVTGHVTLCFVNAHNGRPTKAPRRILDVFSSTAQDENE